MRTATTRDGDAYDIRHAAMGSVSRCDARFVALCLCVYLCVCVSCVSWQATVEDESYEDPSPKSHPDHIHLVV